MKNHLRLLAVFGSLLAGGGVLLLAQDNPANRTDTTQSRSQGGSVAVIDINRIFKEHHRFKARKEEIYKDVKAYEDLVNRQRADIVKQREGLKQYKPGSSKYLQIEESMTNELAQMQVRDGRKRKEVLQREAQNFYDTYAEVTAEVARVADRYGISLVLRYNSEKMDPQNPNSVKMGVNNAIVYQNRRDITDLVLRAINPPRNANLP